VNGKHKRRMSVLTAVLLGSGALAIPLVFSQWSDASAPAVSDPATACQGVGTPGASVTAVPTDKGGPALCITRSGDAPFVRTALYVDGKLAAAIQNDACTWPNAAVAVTAGTLTLPDGSVVVWGTLPKGAQSARLVTTAGGSVEVPAEGDQALPVFATVVDGDATFKAITALGVTPAESTPVAACQGGQK
jgi:hypothetical protein